MSQPIIVVDAFTDKPFAGNPAAVCLLPAARDAIWMQSVAREMNLSETAFLVRRSDGDFDLRWFSPAMEIDLCGHATLASAHVLWQSETISMATIARFHTRSGLLTATWQDPWIELDFPAVTESAVAAPESLLRALDSDVVYTGKNQFDYVVELRTEIEVRNLRPDLGLLSKLDARGVCVTSRASTPGFDFVSRFFGPAVGISEDPVTGSAHCCLGPYWRQRLGKDEFIAYQASARGGVVKVRVEGDRVKLGGQAVTVLRSELVA